VLFRMCPPPTALHGFHVSSLGCFSCRARRVQVEAKKAVPRDEQGGGGGGMPRGNMGPQGGGPAVGAHQGRTKKIFVGGLASSVTEDDFRKYFEQYGTITDVVVMYDHRRSARGFGFITFDDEECVEKVLSQT